MYSFRVLLPFCFKKIGSNRRTRINVHKTLLKINYFLNRTGTQSPWNRGQTELAIWFESELIWVKNKLGLGSIDSVPVESHHVAGLRRILTDRFGHMIFGLETDNVILFIIHVVPLITGNIVCIVCIPNKLTKVIHWKLIIEVLCMLHNTSMNLTAAILKNTDNIPYTTVSNGTY